MVLEKGQIFDGYTIIELLGQGSSGDVYEVSKKNLQYEEEKYAMKFIEIPKIDRDFNVKLKEKNNDQEATIEYFKNEAIRVGEEIRKLMEFTNNPNTKNSFVNFYDYHISEIPENSGHFKIRLYMELLTPLSEFVIEHSIKVNDVFKIAFSILEGLKEMHGKQMVHRDIKPENVFVKKDNNIAIYKIGDLGSAKRVSKSAALSDRGTEFYQDPFRYQVTNKLVIDIYSVSIMLYQLLNNGLFPYCDENEISEEVLIRKLFSGEEIISPKYAENELGRIIVKGLLKPENRYQNVEEMISELNKIYLKYQKENVEYLNEVVLGKGLEEIKDNSFVQIEEQIIPETKQSSNQPKAIERQNATSSEKTIIPSEKINSVDQLYKNKKFGNGIWKYILFVISLSLVILTINVLKKDILITTNEFINTNTFRIIALVVFIILTLFSAIEVIIEPSKEKKKLKYHAKQWKVLSLSYIKEIKKYYNTTNKIKEKYMKGLLEIESNINKVDITNASNKKAIENEDKILGYLLELNMKLKNQEINLEENIDKARFINDCYLDINECYNKI